MTAGYPVNSGSVMSATPKQHGQTHNTFYDSTAGEWWVVGRHTDGDEYLYKWDGVVPASVGASGVFHRNTDWTVALRDSDRTDSWWDDNNRVLHVLANHGSTERYEQASYNGTAWSHDVVNEGPGAVDDTSSAPTTITVDSSGNPHILQINGTNLEDRYRLGGSWFAGATIATGLSTTFSRISSFNCILNGSGCVGGILANNDTDEVQFVYWREADGPSGAWTTEVASAIPGGVSDNHMAAMAWNEPADNTSQIFAFLKNDVNALYACYRNALGTWSSGVQIVTSKSRPAIMIDATNRLGYCIFGDTAGVSNVTKHEVVIMDYSTGELVENVSVANFIETESPAAGDFANATTPSHAVTSEMGYGLVLGSEDIAPWVAIVEIPEIGPSMRINRFVGNQSTHALSGEWDFEDHGPDAAESIFVLPTGDVLPEITHANGQLIYIPVSGVLAITQSGFWTLATSTAALSTAPTDAVYHFPQSGYFDLGNAYPENNASVDTWFTTHDSSGLAIAGSIDAVNPRYPSFRNSLGGAYGKLEFEQGSVTGAQAFLHNGATDLYGGTNVATFGVSFRTPNVDPSGWQAALFTLVTNAGGFTVNAMIRASGTFRVGFNDGTNFCQAHSTTIVEANTNYSLIGVLKSDGDIKLFLDGVDDTANKTNAFTGELQTIAQDVVIGASTTAYANQASGYFITDVGLWFEDFEANGKLNQYQRYLDARLTSLDGS